MGEEMRGFSQATLAVIILARLDAAANVWEGRHTNTTQYHTHRHH